MRQIPGEPRERRITPALAATLFVQAPSPALGEVLLGAAVPCSKEREPPLSFCVQVTVGFYVVMVKVIPQKSCCVSFFLYTLIVFLTVVL